MADNEIMIEIYGTSPYVELDVDQSSIDLEQGEPSVLIAALPIKGDTGATGALGLTGDKGDKGDKGDTGASGPQGIQGLQGIQGITGASGIPGIQGIQGIQGIAGEKGEKGDKGDPGETGASGAQGISLDIQGSVPSWSDLPVDAQPGDAWIVLSDGKMYYRDASGFPAEGLGVPFQGPTGASGASGVPGEAGPVGATGPQGIQGQQGIPGEKGDPGASGAQGVQGLQGIPGEKGDPGPSTLPQGTSLQLFNTADQVTNTERAVFRYNSNVVEIGHFPAGTGQVRDVRIGGANINTTSLTRYLQINSGGNPVFNFVGSLGSGTTQTNFFANCVNSSGRAVNVSIAPTINQSGTAGYTGLLINPTETATGSGTKRLIDAQVGGVSRFSVDNAGSVVAAGPIASTGCVINAPSGSDPLIVKINNNTAWSFTQYGELYGSAGVGFFYDQNISTSGVSAYGALWLTSGKGGASAHDITLDPSGSGKVNVVGNLDVTGAVTGNGIAVARKYATLIGNGTDTSITVTHNLGTRDVTIAIYDAATFEHVNCDKWSATENAVTLGFAVAPASNSYRVVVVG